jgi:hypothetical protein
LEQPFEQALGALPLGLRPLTSDMDFDVFQELHHGVEDDEDQHCPILV